MSSDDFGTENAAGKRRSGGRWYQFSLSSLLYVMLLIGVGAAWLHALRTQRDIRDLRRRLADTSTALEASQAESQARQAQAESLRAQLESAERLGMRRLRESEQLAASLNDVRRNPTPWLLHEEQELLREFRQLQAKQQPAAEAARRRDLFNAKDRDAHTQFLGRLEVRSTFLFSGDLDEAVRYLSEQAKVPIVLQANDLAEAQIPRIRYTKVRCDQATVEQALSQALIWANTHFVRSLQDPRLELVYVLSEPDKADPARLIVTTRRRAAQRGWLPETFMPRPMGE